MMSAVESWIRLEGPLGEGCLHPYAFRCEEGLSRPFDLLIEALSSQDVIEPDVVLGRVVTVFVANPLGQERVFSGVVRDFWLDGIIGRGQRLVKMAIVPRFALLQHARDNRIFQSMTVVDVVKRILHRDNGHDVECALSIRRSSREYIVQYGETTFDFVERLLAEEGLFYYFRHERGRHVMVIGDDETAFMDHPDGDLHFSANVPVGGGLSAWRSGFVVHAGRYTLGGFDELKPAATVRETATARHAIEPMGTIEWYDHRGLPLRDGEAAAAVRRGMEREEMKFQSACGDSLYARLAPGMRCKIAAHPVRAECGRSWVVAKVSHEAVAGAASPDGGETFYRNSFSALQSDSRFRPPVKEPRCMPGLQTATVVGQAGEDIVCDEHGRIKIQFHWDRDGKKDEHSSCWVRVMQPAAGNRWGSIFIPRVGQEVVVQFLEGNPDRPLVIGALYNGGNRPPWDLPAAKTQSGIVTRTTPGGQMTNANVLRFEDKKGSEEVWLRAERDSRRETVHDEVVTVGHNQSISIDNDRKLTVNNGNETVIIAKGNRSVSVSEGKYALKAAESVVLSCGDSSIEMSPTGVTIKAGAVTIQGKMKVDIDGAVTNVKGTSSVVIDGGIVRIN
ncbi:MULTISPECIES: type VI secretion system tip protein TssI/VgrG [unclassified Chelatococcus]|uniref:type VI secretion system Vgr family protein n=1 Tax=unclassified Chelatococcus TaxID=2638111 RepID=UPI001BD06BC8|nr:MULTISPECIES: type VI secretion system tip protein TssI/VgrG [unclassified Chelatococcus]CAH1653502.1 VgrG protein [Hyphomicrobiales bacterium]MBS7740127.1 type VI secretion system tip protein VgrG [Chelatococcus sp. HY11]MBX3545044.1 type VI secretion system tip protein VgrG [Chelatococcus sp.]MCO5078573.1 type VI secretion system tip protein VgrG [Chelatococcus sp.]CAH1685684.1 VgrG protein [Hyphomicrobiales bacterium]